MTIRSQITLIVGIIISEHSELLEEIAELDILYTLAFTNINQSALNLIKMYVTLRSQMIHTVDLIRTEHLQLSALELEKLL